MWDSYFRSDAKNLPEENGKRISIQFHHILLHISHFSEVSEQSQSALVVSDIYPCHSQGLITIFDVSLSQLSSAIPRSVLPFLIICVAVRMGVLWINEGDAAGPSSSHSSAEFYILCLMRRNYAVTQAWEIQRETKQVIYPVAPSYFTTSTRYDKFMRRVWVHKKHIRFFLNI